MRPGSHRTSATHAAWQCERIGRTASGSHKLAEPAHIRAMLSAHIRATLTDRRCAYAGSRWIDGK